VATVSLNSERFAKPDGISLINRLCFNTAKKSPAAGLGALDPSMLLAGPLPIPFGLIRIDFAHPF
jgi:hypothetical protein